MMTIKESLQNLTDEQLRGAEWAFRYVLTSPVLRGQARYASGITGCGVCHDPNCKEPNGQH